MPLFFTDLNFICRTGTFDMALRASSDPSNLQSTDQDGDDGGVSDNLSGSDTDSEDEGVPASLRVNAQSAGINVNTTGSKNRLTINAANMGRIAPATAAVATTSAGATIPAVATTPAASTPLAPTACSPAVPLCVQCGQAPGLSEKRSMHELTALRTVSAMFGNDSFMTSVPPQGE